MLKIKKILYFFKIKRYFFLQGIKKISKFYSNKKFLVFDLCFSFIYLFFNPYRISRKFLQKKTNQKIYDYGETPLLEIKKIFFECDINSSDKFLELGAGRGQVSFWLYYFVNCEIVAIERIPIFVKIANLLIKIFKIKNFKYLCRDMFLTFLEEFDVIYLYGTNLSDKKIRLLINQFKKQPSSVKIITISYSLNEYDKNFIVKKSFDIIFPWGRTKAYLNVKRS